MDVQIASLAHQPEGVFEQFADACANSKKAQELQEQADELGDAASILAEHLAGLDDGENAHIYAQMIKNHLQEREALVNTL